MATLQPLDKFIIGQLRVMAKSKRVPPTTRVKILDRLAIIAGVYAPPQDMVNGSQIPPVAGDAVESVLEQAKKMKRRGDGIPHSKPSGS